MDAIAGVLDECDLGRNQRVVVGYVEFQFDEFVLVDGIVWPHDVRLKRTKIVVLEIDKEFGTVFGKSLALADQAFYAR